MARSPEIMNAQEAAAFLGVHVETLRRLARRKEIPCFKIGKDWRFRTRTLLQWTELQHPSEEDPSVLVIDDEPEVMEALAGMAERCGCRARQAEGGREGLEIVAREAPEIVLLDLNMPDLNGPQFLAELRKEHPSLPVVIVTAYPHGELMRQAMNYAPIMLLPKPVDRELLQRTLRSISPKQEVPVR